MSKQTEALKLALEALSPWAGEDANHTEQYAAYHAIREALAEQETVLPGGGHVPAVPVAVYGYCPECGGAGVMRERRPNGDDKCTNGHKYPSSKALAEQPAQQQEPEPDRVKFERHWRKTRGDKKANRELPRHPLQPQTYIQDSANRHWVTWQVAVRSVAPPAQRKPLTDEELVDVASNCGMNGLNIHGYTFARAIEAAHGIKENT